MAMTGESSVEYQRAMFKEIRQLIKQNTWCSIPRSDVKLGIEGRMGSGMNGT